MVLSITICEVNVLLTAFDVANRAGAPGCGVPLEPFNATANSTIPKGDTVQSCAGVLNTATMWTLMFFLVLVFVGFLIPFMIFFYESNEAGRKVSSRICEALQYQGIGLVLGGLALGIMYWQINSFTYPVISVQVEATVDAPAITCTSASTGCLANLLFANFNARFLTHSAVNPVT